MGIILETSANCGLTINVYWVFVTSGSRSDIDNGCLVWGQVPYVLMWRIIVDF